MDRRKKPDSTPSTPTWFPDDDDSPRAESAAPHPSAEAAAPSSGARPGESAPPAGEAPFAEQTEAGDAPESAEAPAPAEPPAPPPPPPIRRGGVIRDAARRIDRTARSTYVRPRPPEPPPSPKPAAPSESTALTGAVRPAERAPGVPPGGEGGVQRGAVPVDEPGPGATPASPSPATLDAAPYVRVLEVRKMDWAAVREAVANPIAGERAERIVARMEERLAGDGTLGLAFEEHAAGPDDRAIQVGEKSPPGEVWFVGDVHGDLLALEAALQHVARSGGGADGRVVFLGDLVDDGPHAAEVVLRVFEMVLDGPMRVTVLAGNHDEALAFADGQFSSTVIPSDFTDWLNANPDHPWAARLGQLIIRFFERVPRALFFPDGLLVAHGGVPHTDLHDGLARSRDWNDPRVLQDFVWLRAHPRARKRIPNRTTRGSEFGREDFAAFCALATRLGRPVERMLRGHDHVEERFAVFPSWKAHPALTINTMSHRLPREVFGEYERVPVVARWVRGELPEVRRLFVPPELVREVYPEPGVREEEAG
ncbi:MAG TPA: metallophosphoesterase family protein [Longimicrobium sp.]|nr:metallophosphoesterase family protein [Longimicrobium sp.]